MASLFICLLTHLCFVQFFPRDAMHSAADAVVRCLSVCLSHFVYCVKMSRHKYMTFSPSGRSTVQVFLRILNVITIFGGRP